MAAFSSYVWNLSEIHYEEKEKLLLSCSGYFVITWNMVTIGEVVSASDNDQVKATEKDYVNVKPMWALCEFVALLQIRY